MKKRIVLLGLIFVFILSLNLSAFTSSKVEGIVVDEDTGEPIEGANVYLRAAFPKYLTVKHEMEWETSTDSEGYFKFDIKQNLKRLHLICYIQVKKRGYIPFIPKYYFKYLKKKAKADVFRVFEISEGVIKHVRIKLKRGGIIKGKFKAKDSEGIFPLSNFGLFLRRKTNPCPEILRDEKSSDYTIAFLHMDENGYVEINGVKSYDDYYMEFVFGGYSAKYIKNISVNKGEVVNIEKTIDLTDPTGVKGEVTVNSEKVYYIFLYIWPSNLKEIEEKKNNTCYFQIKRDNKFFCKGLDPGMYNLRIAVEIKNRGANGAKKYIKKLTIRIEEGITKKLNINLREEDRVR